MKMIKFFILFPIALFIAFGGIVQVVSAQSPAGLEYLLEFGEAERIATGFINTEGPVWHHDGYLLFSDINGDTIYKWTSDGKIEKFRSPSGMSNGLTFDKLGRLIACEHNNRRVSRTEPDGTIVTLANEYKGKRLNSPNDAVVKSDGSIYFTDPPYGLPPWGSEGKQELSFQGVYRILPDGKTLELLVKDIYRPNGLAFSPDEKVLYVADSEGSRYVHAFDVQPDGTLANRRIFVKNVGYPDGIKVDLSGNLYVTTNISSVKIFDNTGKHLGDIATPEITRNCTFGGPENKTLFITAMTSVYRVQSKIQEVQLVVGSD